MKCADTTSDEFCGGRDKITAYKIESTDENGGSKAGYIGCYADVKRDRAMNLEGKHFLEDVSNAMTSEVSVEEYVVWDCWLVALALASRSPSFTHNILERREHTVLIMIEQHLQATPSRVGLHLFRSCLKVLTRQIFIR